jgi:hypothetical protein
MLWAACFFVWWKPLAVADFRREYQLSTADLAHLPAVEFVQLVIGLSRRSEVSRRVSGDPEDQLLSALSGGRVRTSAPQQRYRKKPEVPKGDEYVRAARRLHGRVHVVKAGDAHT